MPFLNPLDVRLVDPQANAHTGQWQLLVELFYKSERAGKTIIVPQGFTTDFASVPRRSVLLWGLFGGRAIRAAAVHDYITRYRVFGREKCDQIFLEAMYADGVPITKALPMYLGVAAYTASGMWKTEIDAPDFEPMA